MKVGYTLVQGRLYVSADDMLANMLETKVQLLERVSNERERQFATAAIDVYIKWLKGVTGV